MRGVCRKSSKRRIYDVWIDFVLEGALPPKPYEHNIHVQGEIDGGLMKRLKIGKDDVW